MKYFYYCKDDDAVYVKNKYAFTHFDCWGLYDIDLTLIDDIDSFIQELYRVISYKVSEDIYFEFPSITAHNQIIIFIKVENKSRKFRLFNPTSEILSKLLLSVKNIDNGTKELIKLISEISDEIKLRIKLE